MSAVQAPYRPTVIPQRRAGLWARLRVASVYDVYAVFIAAVLPLHAVQPAVRGVSLFNIINIVVVGILLIATVARAWRITHRFIVPVIVYVAGSVMAMLNSDYVYINIYTLFQDLYLYLWMSIMISMMLWKTDMVYKLINWWALSSAAVFAISVALGLGIDADRIEFTFQNPNRAATYWVVTAFMMFHPSVPNRFRFVIWPVTVVGVVMTGSNSGVLSFAVGIGLFVLIRALMSPNNRPGAVGALVVTAMVFGGVVVFATYGAEHLLELVGQVSSGGDETSSRIDRSSAVRFDIWAAGIETFREYPMGIGPASFSRQVEIYSMGGTRLELHSDFVASLVERGVIGLTGFLMFLIAIGVTIAQSLRIAVRSGDRPALTWTTALAAMAIAYLTAAVTHEILHEDVFWVVLALIASNHTVLQRSQWLRWRRSTAPRRPLNSPALV